MADKQDIGSLLKKTPAPPPGLKRGQGVSLTTSTPQGSTEVLPQQGNEVIEHKGKDVIPQEGIELKYERMTFYPSPSQLDKLDELVMAYKKQTHKRINRNELLRRLIDVASIDMILG